MNINLGLLRKIKDVPYKYFHNILMMFSVVFLLFNKAKAFFILSITEKTTKNTETV